MEWMLSQNPKVPKNQRTAGYDTETEEVFLSAKLFGNPATLFLCLSFDGVDAVFQDNDLYVPASWLMREFPTYAADIDDAVKKVRDYLTNNKTKDENND